VRVHTIAAAVVTDEAARRRLAVTVAAVALATLLVVGSPGESQAGHSYPRLANIYFPHLDEADLELLSQWDLLVLSKRAEDDHQAELSQLRSLNPDITLLAHMAVGYSHDFDYPPINADLSQALEENNWWMRNTAGDRVVYGPGNIMMNMTLECPTNDQGQRLCDWLPHYIAERLYEGGRWDGLFLDYCLIRISWLEQYQPHPFDHDLDGLPEDPDVLNETWRLGLRQCLSTLRELVGDDFLLVANGNNDYYDICDGDTREKFPQMNGDWYHNMFNEEHGYLAYEALYRQPTTNIINFIYEGPLVGGEPLRGGEFDRQFKFCLTSTLVFGSGYFSCDGPAHTETWWLEYYDIDLGGPLDRCEDVDIPEGMIPPWVDLTELIKKRRYDNGIAVINPCLWNIEIPLGGAYYDIHSWNGEFYEFSGLTTTVPVLAQSGEVLVGNGVVPIHKINSASAVASRESVVLTWDAVDGAASYSIYRAKIDSTGHPVRKMLVSVVDEECYTDNNVVGASNYRYYIAPIDGWRCEGRQSRAIEVSTEPGSDLSIALTFDELDGPPALHQNGQSEHGHTAGFQTADPADRLSADQIVTDGAGADGADVGAPRTSVTGVWPTPATERTAVSFSLSGERGGDGTTRLGVFDVSGRLVRRLVDGPLGPGEHTREWDLTTGSGERVAAGCYLVVLEHGGERSVAKSLVLR
jgi:hypothetical protein